MLEKKTHNSAVADLINGRFEAPHGYLTHSIPCD